MRNLPFVLAGWLVLMAVSVFAGTDARKRLLERVQTLESREKLSSDAARRIRWHVLESDRLRIEVEKIDAVFGFDRKTDPQLDVRLRILGGEITGANYKGQMFPNRNSPSILTMLGVAFHDNLRIEANPWFGADSDSNWLPAIFGKIHAYRNNRFLAARQANQGLDLLEPGSKEAARMIREIASVFGISSQGPEETAQAMLDKLTADKWFDRTSAIKNRLEAALLLHSGRTQEALERYLAIVKEDGKSDSTYYRIAEIYASQGRTGEFNKALREGLTSFPRSSVLLTRYATELFNNRRVEAAKEQIEKCLEASPEYPYAHLLLARILAETGEHERAMKSCLDTLRFSHGWGTDFVSLVDEALQAIEKGKTVHRE